MVKKSYQYVWSVCQEAIKRRKLEPKITTRKMFKSRLESKWHPERLTAAELEHVLSPETLKSWAGLSLQERTLRLSRHFSMRRVSIYYLRKAYRQHGIKKKKIRHTKLISSH